MLNPTFSKSVCRAIRVPYVLEGSLARTTVEGNKVFDTGTEYRLQAVYGDELWRKLERAGFSASRLVDSDILEVCAGTGFLTYHLLKRCQPKSLTVNDVSEQEMRASRTLLAGAQPAVPVSWILGDMHELNFNRQFDLIIGNSFLHHFHDVPRALARFSDLLRRGGAFISLHEPTPMSTVVEGGKSWVYPLAVMLPALVNDVARMRYKGEPSLTDIWMFQSRELKQVALKSGFSRVRLIPWHLFRPIAVQKQGLHLRADKPALTVAEELVLRRAVAVDAFLNRLLPARFFGSVCLVCEK